MVRYSPRKQKSRLQISATLPISRPLGGVNPQQHRVQPIVHTSLTVNCNHDARMHPFKICHAVVTKLYCIIFDCKNSLKHTETQNLTP